MNLSRLLIQQCTSLLTAVALVGCATAPIPHQRIVTAQASIRASEEVGAERTPAAALQLRLAREELAQARRKMAAEENEAARYLLMRSEVDAELALALARETTARNQAQAATQQARSAQEGLR